MGLNAATRAGLLKKARDLGEPARVVGYIGTVDCLLYGYPGHHIDEESEIDGITRIRVDEELHRLSLIGHDPGDEDGDARRPPWRGWR